MTEIRNKTCEPHRCLAGGFFLYFILWMRQVHFESEQPVALAQ